MDERGLFVVEDKGKYYSDSKHGWHGLEDASVFRNRTSAQFWLGFIRGVVGGVAVTDKVRVLRLQVGTDCA